MKKCLYCKKKIQDSSKECRYCIESSVNDKNFSKKENEESIKTIQKVEKDKNKKIVPIISIIILVIIGIITNGIQNFYELGQVMGFVLSGFLFGYLLSYLLIKLIKPKYGIKSTIISSIGYGIILLLVIGQEIPSYINDKVKNKEIHNIISSISLDYDGTISFNENIELYSENGKKFKIYIDYVINEDKKYKNILEEYEERLYGDKVFDTYNNIKNSVNAHDELIEFLTKTNGNLIKKVLEEYKRIFGDSLKNEKYQEFYNREVGLTNERIKLYNLSKKLYKFYLDNFNSILIEDGELTLGGDIYDEYEKVYDEYEDAYNTFGQYRLNYLKYYKNKFNNYGK